MQNIEVRNNNIPATREELAKFVLVGRERLTAVRAAIRAIDKAGLAKDVYEQKLAEGQDIAEAVLDAEVRLGEIFSQIPKSNKWESNNQSDNGVGLIKTKSKSIEEETGLSERQAQRLQELYHNPQAVEIAKKQAREDGVMVTRSQVKKIIDVGKIPKEQKMENTYKPSKTIACPQCGLEIELV